MQRLKGVAASPGIAIGVGHVLGSRIDVHERRIPAAGVEAEIRRFEEALSQTDAQLSAMLRSGIPFSNAPGMTYEYSNYGFAILGRIVSNVSGMPYKDYVAKWINARFPAGSKPAQTNAGR